MMNGWDIFLIVVLIVSVGAAIRQIYKNKKRGIHCGGNCAQCDRRCL